MTLKRKEVRVWFDADDHTRLAILCRRKGLDLGEFIAHLAIPAIRSTCDEASEIASDLREAGISRTGA